MATNIALEFRQGNLNINSPIGSLKAIGEFYEARWNRIGIRTIKDLAKAFEGQDSIFIRHILSTVYTNKRYNECIPPKKAAKKPKKSAKKSAKKPVSKLKYHNRDVNFYAYRNTLQLLRYIKNNPKLLYPKTRKQKLDMQIPINRKATSDASQRCSCLNTVSTCKKLSSCKWAKGQCIPKDHKSAFQGRRNLAGQRIPPRKPKGSNKYGPPIKSTDGNIYQWRIAKKKVKRK